ncbi:probable membrane protein YPO3302 [hydrothermal vent metagenome]|uniref:Probable membrane protein YPO3302 n=1 Tax=hydrothermal vent metagenome TaxID=652676 RepID=A0A3B0W538_9ZZZZ
MIEFLFSLGYVGLFIISFLAASLIPLSSELFVLGLPTLGYNVWWVILVATAGNYCGALLNYYIGKKGANSALGRRMKIKPETWAKAERFYKKWGPVALFFSWVPIIGDPLTAVAGALNLHLGIFTFWVLLGKGIRYFVLLGIAAQFLDIL